MVEDGRFTALESDPLHPTGQALCAKGRAAPELVYHPNRLLHPLKRTRPKGDPDPGWQQISWDEALDLTAANLRRLADQYGPESVMFSIASPSTSAISDSIVWIERLVRAFGSPNMCASMELCGWGRYGATQYTFGAGVPGVYMPDIENAGCLLFWGYNPNNVRISHATATTAALKRGARLIVVDPRRTGLAKKADVWLQVRPGSDSALALGIANVMIERGWYDDAFIRQWSNGPLLVRPDDGRLLTEADLVEDGSRQRFIAWNEATSRPVIYDPATGQYENDTAHLALFGEHPVKTPAGMLACRPAFDLVAETCRRFTPEAVESICWVQPEQVVDAARLLWESRPVAYYAWSGVEQHTNATEIARAIGQLYALTGSFDDRGGNVQFAAAPTVNVAGHDLLSADQRARTVGMGDRPMGPARWQHTTSEEFYRAVLDEQPYAVRGLVGFGANLLLSHADSQRGREALAALEFYVHTDLFMNPTAELADVILPASTPFEHEALRLGFEISPAAQSLIQLRQPVVQPQGEARSDMEIVFDLARRLGLGSQFWDCDIDAAYRHQLAPSGISLEALRASPRGIQPPVETRYRKYAEEQDGIPRGFATPTRKIELYSQTLLEAGYPPLPGFEEPLVSPFSQPELAERYPLIFTCAKHTLFCESQHRALPSLRRRAREPEIELHPDTAVARGINAGDWVAIETPNGSVRARAKFDDTLNPRVVCGQHGWWQACPEIDAPGYPAFDETGANVNLLIGSEAADPISGSTPLRSYLCQVSRI